jgi:hypothetical protein
MDLENPFEDSYEKFLKWSIMGKGLSQHENNMVVEKSGITLYKEPQID